MLNRDFPHAIRYCVDGIRDAIDSIQRTGGRRSPDELTAGIGRLHAMLGLHHHWRDSGRRRGGVSCTPFASNACAFMS